jgi:hypothetical protein
LKRISGTSVLSPEQAWANGTNVVAAYNANPAQTEAALILLLKKTLMALDMNKTIRTDEDLLFAVEHLRTEFPAMKLEEWAIIMQRLKTGKYPVQYERLKLPELVAIFRAYEGERAERREQAWGELKKVTPDTMSDEQVQAMYKRYQQQREEKQQQRAQQEDIKPVETDERGRWKHIPYQSPQEDEVQQERGSQET